MKRPTRGPPSRIVTVEFGEEVPTGFHHRQFGNGVGGAPHAGTLARCHAGGHRRLVGTAGIGEELSQERADPLRNARDQRDGSGSRFRDTTTLDVAPCNTPGVTRRSCQCFRPVSRRLSVPCAHIPDRARGVTGRSRWRIVRVGRACIARRCVVNGPTSIDTDSPTGELSGRFLGRHPLTAGRAPDTSEAATPYFPHVPTR